MTLPRPVLIGPATPVGTVTGVNVQAKGRQKGRE